MCIKKEFNPQKSLLFAQRVPQYFSGIGLNSIPFVNLKIKGQISMPFLIL